MLYSIGETRFVPSYEKKYNGGLAQRTPVQLYFAVFYERDCSHIMSAGFWHF